MDVAHNTELTEAEFLEQYQPGDYDRPSVTADILVFTIENVKEPVLKLLLVKRGEHPYKHCWALPGGFVGINESIDDAAKRELKEETGLDGIYLEQLYTFGDPGRDPRMRVITSAYMALIPEGAVTPQAGDDAADARWFHVSLSRDGDKTQLVLADEESAVEMRYHISRSVRINGVIGSLYTDIRPDKTSTAKLAFDHAEIVNMAINRIVGKCDYTPILFNLMPKVFTIPELQSVYELFLEKRPHNTLFRQKISRFIEETGEVDRSTFRPAKLYRYKQRL